MVAKEPPTPTILTLRSLTSRLSVRLGSCRCIDADDPCRLFAEDYVRVCDAGRRHDHVAGPGVEALSLDRPAHAPGADRDHVTLRRIVDVHLLDLAGWVGDQVNLEVVEPDALVLVVRPHEAAVVGLVGDLDHAASLPRVGVPDPRTEGMGVWVGPHGRRDRGLLCSTKRRPSIP